MKKVRIIKNKETYFESHFYISYENEKIIEIDFNDLHDANLRCTDLRNADLSGANLNNADLRNADLSGANLRSANLYNANLSYANLSYADLRGTNLSYVNLQYANLQYAILDEEERIRKGKIINKKTFVYKKCQGKIVKLELQIGSIVFSINNKKCRTNKAKVISIDGNNKKGLQIESDYDNNFIYEVGKIVEVPNFNLMYNVECASGIHFFWTEKEAKKYFS
nr:MAG TPA: neurotoxin [Caudoviricetes sp.]